MHPSLPDPDPQALERSAELARLIRAAIAAEPTQSIGFDHYMRLALYTPDLGYYSGANQIFGSTGDFVTAPESGSLFARCLSAQCAQVLQQTGGGIIEYGAGSGQLALALLQALPARVRAHDFSYHIVEPSAQLRRRQQDLLLASVPDLFARISWSAVPPQTQSVGVTLANEVVDAMPARRFVVVDHTVLELGVAIGDEGFVWCTRGSANVPVDLDAAVSCYADGYCCEALATLPEWLGQIGAHVERGVVLISDYGYPRHEYLHVARNLGTLKCHYRQHAHDDPFLWPGLQDLTMAVNFSDLAEAGVAAGFELAGYTTQTRFLIDCGLEDIMAGAMVGDSTADYLLAQEAKRLLLPGEMGQTVKFMAFARNFGDVLIGFTSDQRHHLGGFQEAYAP